MRRKLSKAERQAVYDRYGGRCAYCGCKLDLKDMQVDHIESIRRHDLDDIYGKDVSWLNEINNLNPACRACNFYKGEMPLDFMREQLGEILKRLDKVFIFRLAVKYGLVQITPKPIKFYFERGRL